MNTDIVRVHVIIPKINKYKHSEIQQVEKILCMKY